MAVTFIGNGVFRGLAADTKPTTNVPANAIYMETDGNRRKWYWTGAAWIQIHADLATANTFTETMTLTKASAASTFEVLQVWKVSDDTISAVTLMNNTNTDGHFTPLLIGSYGQASPSHRGFTLRSQIPTAQDSGTTPVMVFDVRKSDGAAVTTRPLFEFHSVNTAVFKIDPLTVSTVLPITVTKNAEVGIAEILSTWQVAASGTSRVEIRNSTATGGEFHPQIRSFNMSANTVGPGLYVDSFIDTAQDSGTQHVVIFRAFKADSTALVTRPLYSFKNANSTLLAIGQTQIDTPLTIAINKTAATGVAEVLQTWKVSDDASSLVELRNAVGTDGEFIPWLKSYNYAAHTTSPGLYIYSHILNTQDSGSSPVLIFDSRRTDNAAITARPLFDFRTAGTSVFTLTPTLLALKDAYNIQIGTTTGTKIGTATTQKIGFYNKTPIVQPTAISSPTADVNSLKTAVDALRTTLINLGLTA